MKEEGYLQRQTFERKENKTYKINTYIKVTDYI